MKNSKLIYIILIGVVIYLSIEYYNNLVTIEENKEILKQEKIQEQDLRNDLVNLLDAFDKAKDEIDNLEEYAEIQERKLDSLRDEVKNLLKVEGDLVKAKIKINTLKDISIKYFKEVDSLNLLTKELSDSLIIFRDKNRLLELEQDQKRKIIQDQDLKIKQLSEKEVLASQLKLREIVVTPMSKKISLINKDEILKSVRQRKAERTHVLSVKFKIDHNQLASGDKVIAIQYLNSQSQLLGDSTIYSINNDNDKTYYTITDTIIDYSNSISSWEVNWERKDVLNKGEYKIIIFIDDKVAAKSSFVLN
ncbi:MAG: hypothetical protein CMP51_01740 [Flavobacteriales bacterium]|nr:hypothetical protein [Flavobacteriales bacterium]